MTFYLRLALVAVIFAAGVAAGLRWDAVKVEQIHSEFADYRAAQAEAVARQQAANAQEAARQAAQQREEALAHETRLATLQSDNDRLADRLRREPVRVCSTSTSSTSLPTHAAGPGGGPDTPVGGILHSEAGIALVRLARDADKVTEALRLCLAGYPNK